MNNFNLIGKIQRVNISETQKNAFITILNKPTKDTSEFITVTSFNPQFVAKYLRKDKWIGCTGHIHINKYNDKYLTELIVDNFYFVGEPSSLDKELNETYNAQGYNPLQESQNFNVDEIFGSLEQQVFPQSAFTNTTE